MKSDKIEPVAVTAAAPAAAAAVPAPVVETPSLARGLRGKDGHDGPAGLSGPGFTWRGAYDKGIEYKANDVVQHHGSAWIATKASTEEPSAAAKNWDLMVSGGKR